MSCEPLAPPFLHWVIKSRQLLLSEVVAGTAVVVVVRLSCGQRSTGMSTLGSTPPAVCCPARSKAVALASLCSLSCQQAVSIDWVCAWSQ